MVTDEALGGDVHRVGVERPVNLPDVPTGQGRRAAPIEDAIAVMATDRRMARVEGPRHDLGGEDRDRLWPEVGIQGVPHRVGAPILAEIEMRDLMDGVHARIRAAGAGEPDGLAGEPPHGLFKGRLDGRSFGLALPTVEGRAVVLDDQLVARHIRRAWCLRGVSLPRTQRAPYRHGAPTLGSPPRGEGTRPDPASSSRPVPAAHRGGSPRRWLHRPCRPGAMREAAPRPCRRRSSTPRRAVSRGRWIRPGERVQHLHPLRTLAEIGLEERARERRQAVDLTRDRLGAPASSRSAPHRW